MTTTTLLAGGCHCGAVRYEAAGLPFHATVCHCSACRRTSGAASVAWFSVLRSEFRWTAGAPAAHRSSAHGLRRFCPSCGTQLTFESSRAPDDVDITTCSLDDPAQVPPTDHTHVADKPAWETVDDGLPLHSGVRSGA